MSEKQLHLQYSQTFNPSPHEITASSYYSFLIQLCFFGRGIKLA